ncbi:Uncharacterised protein [Mycobacteroides abscessus]|nr:Uncharacterised protein [Mycobacteroides abscessus]SHX73195.1 Uncharacterised protein [Mycobacteroides abscessus subsp. abscessus]SIL53520.1 Uncharacterised protein [Mycobacteroides abscessus subsp. abscessus]SIL54600.1 Uncharacterised protein [Mycobacteroides abscessus subsp. abscessus]
MPFDLVAEQTRKPAEAASSKAYRMMRSHPIRVKTDSCSANSFWLPRL